MKIYLLFGSVTLNEGCRTCYVTKKDATGGSGRLEVEMEEMNSKVKKEYFISVRDLAMILPVSKSLIYDMIYREEIPCKRIGRRILIPISFVQEYLI